jgi:hypothetical protein
MQFCPTLCRIAGDHTYLSPDRFCTQKVHGAEPWSRAMLNSSGPWSCAMPHSVGQHIGIHLFRGEFAKIFANMLGHDSGT